ncbi:reverse transcriptase domain-containing protein [Tanacetum coccineum]|uniref:Reverse transcriptase domain-containing protein n=1 Tax=Tanacetum coccineum TaxID=301880 RepID=A0ABQ4XFD1_9ASTR
MKAITTRSGVAYEGPSIHTNPSPKKVVERETEETTDKEQINFQGSTAHIQPPVIPIPIPEPNVLKTLPKPNIPYPSRLNDQKLREKATNQTENFFQIFQDLHFDISFADALLLMPKFASTIKSLLTNKDKLFELANIPLNENCSAMLLKNLPEKLGDLGKFLIPCDFPGMDVCHALADLSASINLMPSLPELTPTRMTFELADQSITRPKGVAKDVFVKVGKFHFPTDFVVVDFKADPLVPLILVGSFLRTGRALIDDNFKEVLRLKKSNHLSSGSNTPLSDSHPSLTSFETSNSLLEEFADELALLEEFADELALLDPFPPGNEDVDFEADLREIELLLNRDLSTDFSPKIMIDPNPERFINEPTLVCLPPPGDDDKEKTIPLNELLSSSYAITSLLPTIEPEDSLIMGDEHLSTFLEKETDEFIKSSVKEIDIENEDSNVSNFNEPVLLNTSLFNEDECLDPGGDIDEIDAFLDDYKD